MFKAVCQSTTLLTFIIALLSFSIPSDLRQETLLATTTPNFSYLDLFPTGLSCPEIQSGLGPTWRDFIIGKSMVKEFEEEYGEFTPFYNMLVNETAYPIYLCEENGIITAIKVGAHLPYFTDYIALFGPPDAVTYSQPVSRVLFWFEEGIAIDVYINTTVEEYYGVVNFVVYFPYQEAEGYEDRWPYNRTASEGISAQDENVSDAQNPFDFESIVATMTAQPTSTPQPSPTAIP